MELRSQLIRPSRNKHRSQAVMAVRLLDRRETVTKLEQQLSTAKLDFEQEELDTSDLWRKVEESRKKLEKDEKWSSHHFISNEKNKEKARISIVKGDKECQLLEKECSRVKHLIKNLETDIEQMSTRLKFLQHYQSTLSDVEGFDRVISKFQELNQTWQNMTEEYRNILGNPDVPTTFKENEEVMELLMTLNSEDVDRINNTNREILNDKVSRNKNWQIGSITESFKQHGHLYLAILNLAAHLSAHSVSRTLMNIGNFKKRTSSAAKKDATTMSSDQKNPGDLSARWKKLALVALNEHRLHIQVRDTSRTTSDMETSTKEGVKNTIGPETDNLITSREDYVVEDISSSKSDILNKTAEVKLNFIEQILYDLTLIREEIEFQTDPVHYNNPGLSL